MHDSAILISTLAFAADSWDAVVADLPRDVDCRAVSLPGHGEPASLASWDAPEIAAWVDERPRPPHVIAAGAGSLVAERLVRTTQVASLTLVGWPPDQRPGEMHQRVVATRRAV